MYLVCIIHFVMPVPAFCRSCRFHASSLVENAIYPTFQWANADAGWSVNPRKSDYELRTNVADVTMRSNEEDALINPPLISLHEPEEGSADVPGEQMDLSFVRALDTCPNVPGELLGMSFFRDDAMGAVLPAEGMGVSSPVGWHPVTGIVMHVSVCTLLVWWSRTLQRLSSEHGKRV